MNAKLTLSLDSEVIAQAKHFAALNETSLSQMVQDYFIMLNSRGDIIVDAPISRKLQSLVGMGSGDFDEEDYRRHLEAKNSK